VNTEQPAVRPSVLLVVFLAAVLFPYVQLVPIGTEGVQPVALCLAVPVVLFSQRWVSAPAPIWLLAALMFVALCILLAGDLDLPAIRSFGNYTSLFVITLASYSCATQVQRLIPRMVILSIWVWLAVGVIQAFYSPDFLYSLLPDVRRSESRGVVSLAPEPGYYATMLLFCLILLFLYRRERSIHSLVGIAQIALLARSAMVTVILMVIIGVYAILRFEAKKVLGVMALLLAGWSVPTYTNYFEGTRMGDLAKLAMAAPSELVRKDASISDRIGQIAFSLKGAIDNWLLPNGFNSWGHYYNSEMLKAANYFTMYWGDPPTRIQSGIGAPIYELGFFGLFPLWVLVAGIKSRYGSLRSGPAIALGTALGLSMLPGTPLAMPIYGFILGQLFAFRVVERPLNRCLPL
jgi:hypothetical protein